MINVTKPFLPNFSEYKAYLDGIWERNWLTNNGPLVNDLELKLKDYLGLQHLLYLTNGTVALQLAIKALGLTGEVITTPFSFVATTTSIIWEGCTPVFADIDPLTLNIDASKIEALITERTTGILATHVYGIPCAVEQIEEIATRHNLRVIYDAAHAFGVKYRGTSLFNFGDIATASFHATKIFHTIEGGAVITNSAAITKQLSLLRNFGFQMPDNSVTAGINAKNSEFHAAMGLAVLHHIDELLATRKQQSLAYDKALVNLKVTRPHIPANTEWNYSYYPIIFQSEEQLLKAVEIMNAHWVYPRRYFFPSLSSLSYTGGNCPVSDDISKRVLCLPLYHSLKQEEIDFIARLLLRAQNN